MISDESKRIGPTGRVTSGCGKVQNLRRKVGLPPNSDLLATLKRGFHCILAVGLIAFLGCWLVAAIVRESTPRTHDEFSYRLMGETLAKGHVANPAPPLPEFFDTFHVIQRPVYASKYFPAQGVFLALGQLLTGHQAVGVWLSSALACVAVTWMLQGWIGTQWGLLGGILVVIQYGIFSYWSQTFWGGMVPALGGALVFGAIRRLWDQVTWQNSVWLGVGFVILVSSRPVEGLVAVLPGTFLLVHHLWRSHIRDSQFHPKLLLPLLPCCFILAAGAFALGAYNRAITGSALKTPYALNEQQYQESPPFIFMPQRPKLTYSSPVVQFYYEINEMRPYLTQRVPKWFVTMAARKLATWWDFYVGFTLTIPLVLPGLLRKGKIRWIQAAVLVALITLSFFLSLKAVLACGLIEAFVIAQVIILWHVFDDKWSRLAIATCGLVEFVLLFAKWEFPHYFAPAACLIWYLEVEGLRKIWNWNSQAVTQPERPLSRGERRRLARENARQKSRFNLRWVVVATPIACVFLLIWNIQQRLDGTLHDPHGTIRQALILDDWSVDRANLEKWLERQSEPQLVFVRYWPNHNINFEWVYNHPDIMQSHVIWARDLGAEHNKLLLSLVPDRKVWLIEADRYHPRLIPYNEAVQRPNLPMGQGTSPLPEQSE